MVSLEVGFLRYFFTSTESDSLYSKLRGSVQ
jgi:hypothetical protein